MNISKPFSAGRFWNQRGKSMLHREQGNSDQLDDEELAPKDRTRPTRKPLDTGTPPPLRHAILTFPTGACGRQAWAASARASPALKMDTTHTLLSSTKTLENVAPVGVVMNGRDDSRHAMPWARETKGSRRVVTRGGQRSARW